MPEERAWLDTLFDDVGYLDVFRVINQREGQYTWWSNRGQAWAKNVGWRIDYFFVNEGYTDQVLDADIHDEVMGSDHCPVSIEISE